MNACATLSSSKTCGDAPAAHRRPRHFDFCGARRQLAPIVSMMCRHICCQVAIAWLAILASAALAAEPDAPKPLTVTWFEMPIHGLAVVLETPAGNAFVIDAGGLDGRRDYNGGRDAIAPYLKARGVEKIAAIAISHPHADHYGGARWLLENYPVGRYVDSGYEGRGLADDYRLIRKLAEQKHIYLKAQAGDRLDWGSDVEVEVLSPPRDYLELKSDPAKITDHGLLNGNSLVLRIRHGDNTFLFPGDAYGMGQRYMLAEIPAEKLRMTVVTAPHHGFNTSPEFAAAVRPRFAIASCLLDYPGSDIRSPAEQATKMYSPHGTKVYATCWSGRIQITSDGKTLDVKTERKWNP